MRLFHLRWRMERKLLFRDDFARMVLIFPLLIALILQGAIRIVSPILADSGIVLANWHAYLFVFFLGLNVPLLYGVIIGFLMLDEADLNTLAALKVTPTPLMHLVWQRVVLAMICTSLTVLFLAVTLGWFAPSQLPRVMVAALISGGYAGVVVLILATFAPNKLAGFALIKLAGFVVVLPIAALFSTHPLSMLAGIIPTYWLARLYVDAGTWIRDGVVSIVWLCVILYWLSWRFQRQHRI